MVRSRLAASLAAAAAALLVAGCSGPASPPARTGSGQPTPSYSQLAPPRAICGTARTAASVPVTVEVETGSVSCPVAMRVQDGYSAAVRSGRVSGNGGGAPVRVDGWTCQGLDTPAILATGEASHCDKGGTEIVAVLATQTGPASPSSSTSPASPSSSG